MWNPQWIRREGGHLTRGVIGNMRWELEYGDAGRLGHFLRSASISEANASFIVFKLELDDGLYC